MPFPRGKFILHDSGRPFPGQRPVFSVEELCFSYGERNVLADFSLALYPGQTIGLAGPNGSGKTTLLRCITGLLKPQKGRIVYEGKIMANEKDFHKLRCNVGYALQNAEDQLFFPSVGEDLAFGPLNLGLGQAEARARAAESLDLVGLPGFEGRLNHELSGGEKKLVALASILAMRPKALLLDEPLNELDPEARGRVENVILGLGCARLIISHDLDFLRRACE